jgi:thiol:disulfide interchange protein DsbC
MKQLQRLSIALLAIMMSMSIYAADELDLAQDQADEAVPVAVETAIRTRFKQSRPSLVISSIKPSDMNGLYEVAIVNGPRLYSTEDGQYFILGDMYEVAPGGFVNIAEKEREGGRAELMASVDLDDMIIFSPKDQPVKASIMVFTDVDCFYCQKLHKEVPDLNRLGIEVRYLAYPRAGLESASYDKIASAWCSVDRQATLTRLKNRENIPLNVCPSNPVASQFELGKQIGVSGTPALVTTEGRLLPGYMPALQLATTLGVEVEPDLAAELYAKQEAQK